MVLLCVRSIKSNDRRHASDNGSQKKDETMKQLKNFVFICTLIFSLSGIAFADGGVTQGPGIAPPAQPDCTETGCQPTESTANAPDPYDSSVFLADVLANWFEIAIL